MKQSLHEYSAKRKERGTKAYQGVRRMCHATKRDKADGLLTTPQRLYVQYHRRFPPFRDLFEAEFVQRHGLYVRPLLVTGRIEDFPLGEGL